MRARHVLLPALLVAAVALLLLLPLSPWAPESGVTEGGAGADDGSGTQDATLVGTGKAARPTAPAASAELPPLQEPAPGGPDRCSLYGTVRRGRSPCAATIEVRRLPDAPGGPRVRLRGPESDAALAYAMAGRDGGYEIGGLPVGRYEVRARYGELVDSRRMVGLSPEGRRERLDLRLPDGRFALRGLLLRADGTPWAGCVFLGPASVAFGERWDVVRALDAEGRFAVEGLPAGRLDVRALHVGTLSVARSRAVVVPHDGEWTWVVDDAIGYLDVLVLDAVDGTPIPGARCSMDSLRSSGSVEADGHTDAEGRCRIPIMRPFDIAAMSATAPGYVEGGVGAPFEDPPVLRLERAGRVEGRVADAGTGDPVVGALVCLVGRDGPGGRAITDAEGRFALDGQPAGRYLLYALGAGWVSAEIDDGVRTAAEALTVDLEEGHTIRRDLRVRKAPRILGRVRDAAGKPVAGALVKASVHARQPPKVLAELLALDSKEYRHVGSSLRSELETVTASGPDGVFVLDGLVPGLAYTVQAEATDQVPVESERVTVGAMGVQRLDLTFPPSRWLEVTVLDAWSGVPLLGAEIHGRAGDVWAASTTDEQGRGRLGPLGEETPALSVEAEGYQGQEEIAIADGASEVTIRLEPGLVMSGRVLLPDGTPLTHTWVLLRRLGRPDEESEQTAYARTDEAGRFETHSLWPGRYVVQSQDRWIDPTAVGSVEAAAGDRDVVLHLEKP